MSRPLGRNRFLGADHKNIVRSLDRATGVIAPKAVNHISQLPPARDNMGRLMFVRGTTKKFYFSDGTTWTAL